MGAQGTATLNFGAFPGAPSATVDVTGQTGFTASSLAEAWVYPKATADHSADEHMIEALKVVAAYQADGTIRIYGEVVPFTGGDLHALEGARSTNCNYGAQAHRLFGQFTIGWVWN